MMDESKRKLDLDVRGILALIAVIGVFVLAFVQLLVAGLTAEIPSWAAALVSAITGFYFGARGASNGQ